VVVLEDRMHQVTTWLVAIIAIDFGERGDDGEYSSEDDGQHYHG